MKFLSLFILSMIVLEAEASCLQHWKNTVELNRKRLNPVAQDNPSRVTNPGTDDQFVGLGESVHGIIERSALIPKVRFQERVIRLMENKQTKVDLEDIRQEYGKRLLPINPKLLTQKLNRLFHSQENLCWDDVQLLSEEHPFPFESPDYVISENEFYKRLFK